MAFFGNPELQPLAAKNPDLQDDLRKLEEWYHRQVTRYEAKIGELKGKIDSRWGRGESEAVKEQTELKNQIDKLERGKANLYSKYLKEQERLLRKHGQTSTLETGHRDTTPRGKEYTLNPL
jgi:hypothetical protein